MCVRALTRHAHGTTVNGLIPQRRSLPHLAHHLGCLGCKLVMDLEGHNVRERQPSEPLREPNLDHYAC
eukprot:742869-Pelagomonas_calceolata.AAC.2